MKHSDYTLEVLYHSFSSWDQYQRISNCSLALKHHNSFYSSHRSYGSYYLLLHALNRGLWETRIWKLIYKLYSVRETGKKSINKTLKKQLNNYNTWTHTVPKNKHKPHYREELRRSKSYWSQSHHYFSHIFYQKEETVPVILSSIWRSTVPVI